jgi:hypothetical protein
LPRSRHYGPQKVRPSVGMTNKKRQPKGGPPRKAIPHKQTQEPSYKTGTWGTPKKQGKTGTPTRKSKTAPLKTKGAAPTIRGRGKTASTVSGAQQKARERNGPATGKETSVKQPLAGGECSRRGDQAAASTRDESIKNTLSPGGPRMPNEPSGQVAAPTQGTAGVRSEFAGRAHRREFTPKLEIKRKENKVKEKEENFGKKEKRIHHRRRREERGSGRELPRVLLRAAVMVRDGRDFLVGDIAAIPPLRTARNVAPAWG